MAGSGTTPVECKLLGRSAVGVDINPDAVMVARNRLDFSYAPLDYVAHVIDKKVTNGFRGVLITTVKSSNSKDKAFVY